MGGNRTYIAIDLKSFYASVECVERGLDPLTTNLVVADQSRTEKTICLAVSPSLKAYGIPGRPRLFEVVQKVKEVNALRRERAPGRTFTGSSSSAPELNADPALAVDYIVAPPQMARYMKISGEVYRIYLKYIAPEDIHVYSIDEVFMDVTNYLGTYGLTPRQLAMKMILDVLDTTGITATAGIGTNLYLAKIAMDIEAKHIEPDENGVRIAELTEMSYRRSLWSHRPLTDFWRVGRGYAKKLEAHGLATMGDIARCSLGSPGDFYNEELLYKLFGINAELLIDHAWGWEPCTFEKARLVVHEMADMLALDLVDKGLVTNQLTLTVGYDIESMKGETGYWGEVTVDRYGRAVPKHAHGTANLERYTSSAKQIVAAVLALFDRIVDKKLLSRRMYLAANRVLPEADAPDRDGMEQMDLFGDAQRRAEESAALEREKRMQQAVLRIKKRYGKNAILKGMNLEEGATAVSRNGQIGGHKA